MLQHPPPPFDAKPEGAMSRALFGEVVRQPHAGGFPERVLRWVDRIPCGLTVYCGHDNRSADGRPATLRGAQGGEAVFLDTGAGKGGHLSWIDLPPCA
jgi:protein phosphatase